MVKVVKETFRAQVELDDSLAIEIQFPREIILVEVIEFEIQKIWALVRLQVDIEKRT